MGAELYHGTAAENLRVVLPAAVTGAAVTFASDTDPRFAYATSDPSTGWCYAEKSWNAHSSGIPRVYRVEPLDVCEADPQVTDQGRSRGNFSGDLRSRSGFRVVEELPFPGNWGDPADWR